MFIYHILASWEGGEEKLWWIRVDGISRLL